MDEARRAAWKAAIAKRRRDEDVPAEEHYALLLPGMLGVKGPEEEALLFLRYWLHGRNIDALPWLGSAIAHHWFWLREWDQSWGRLNRAEKALHDYIAADDYDHWTALNEIAVRLHEKHEIFPDALADWAADVHRRLRDGTFKPPAKKPAHKGGPPYAQEDRNGVYFEADSWLKHYGMSKSEGRVHVIAEYIGDDESVIRKGLTRWRKGDWRRAPWP